MACLDAARVGRSARRDGGTCECLAPGFTVCRCAYRARTLGDLASYGSQSSIVTREQLEHLIRAAATIANDDEIVVIGSQAILGAYPHAPASLLVSVEADVYPRNAPDRADLIDGSIGELSPFHETYGYYAQGVGPTTAVLPTGWESRLVVVSNANTRGAKGLCLDPHDLVLSKYVPFRDKDERFVVEAIRHRIVQREILMSRLADLPISDEQRALLAARIARHFVAS